MGGAEKSGEASRTGTGPVGGRAGRAGAGASGAKGTPGTEELDGVADVPAPSSASTVTIIVAVGRRTLRR